jgi:phospholipid/cholesterol/gamma-HCH transport system ATP-binding protein
MIVIRDVWKRYGKQQVLSGINLEIATGETIVILGRSGVGKSVLLKHIIGITKPDQGSIDIDGVTLSDLEGPALYQAVRNMGMLFQSSALFDSMTIAENTAFYLVQHPDLKTSQINSSQEIQKRVDEALKMVGLQGTQNKMPSELSGGMKKRAALARLIAYRPSILLYDEPTTGLDPITAMHINELIVSTQKELQATSIVVTHDIASALYVADRLSLIEEGKIVHTAAPDVFLQIDDPIIAFLRRTVTEDPRTFREKKIAFADNAHLQ